MVELSVYSIGTYLQSSTKTATGITTRGEPMLAYIAK
jgi:hypothetical protein